MLAITTWLRELGKQLHPDYPSDVVIIDVDWKKDNRIESIESYTKETNVVIYFWAMYYDKDWKINHTSTYSLEVFDGILDHIIKILPKRCKVNVKVATPVSYACNNIEDTKDLVPIDEETRILRKRAYDKLWKKWQERLHISGVETEHHKLLRYIKGNTEITGEETSSLEIYKLLAQVFEEDSHFQQDIYDTMSDRQQTNGNVQYSLYEAAIRISDFLQGKNIQVTTDTSSKINTIIQHLISWKRYSGEAYKRLQTMIRWNSPTDISPISIALQRKKLRKYNRLKEGKEKVLSRRKYTLLWVWAAIWMITWIYQYSKHTTQAEDEAVFEEQLVETIWWAVIIEGFWWPNIQFKYNTQEKRREFLKKTKRLLENMFTAKYGTSQSSDIQIGFMLINQLVTSGFLDYTRDDSYGSAARFLKYFIEKNKAYLKHLWFPVSSPYGIYEPYQDAIEATSQMKENQEFDDWWVTRIGTFIGKFGIEYELGIINCDELSISLGSWPKCIWNHWRLLVARQKQNIPLSFAYRELTHESANNPDYQNRALDIIDWNWWDFWRTIWHNTTYSIWRFNTPDAKDVINELSDLNLL